MEVEEKPVELPTAEEKSPLDLLLDRLDAQEARLAQLEAAMQSHGHNIDETGLGNIARFVEQYLFAKFRGRKPPAG